MFVICGRSTTGDSFTMGTMPPPNQPTANRLAPDLMHALFELEATLLPDRDPSSTIVINRHAQFKPHVDSGAGHGQSKSLIVGLGDYTGGELVVEGVANDIRYRPLEFDGWKQRHWTLPFEGERFSIVYFTPHGAIPAGIGRHARLRNDTKIPRLGFGTFRLKKENVVAPIKAALAMGYTHIDTAALYKNEKFISDVLKQNSNKLSIIFLTSKLPPDAHGYDAATKTIKETVATFGRPLDLYLIHWPGTKGRALDDVDNLTRRHQSWRALEDAYDRGDVRAIGVSNFQIEHLQALLKVCRIVPHVNQVELHPQLQQSDLVKFCQSKEIQLIAYASLGVGDLVTNSTVCIVATLLGRTPAQVLLRWGIQKGYCVIPKATSQEHIASNTMVFDFVIPSSEMVLLDSLNAVPVRYCWNPEEIS